MKKMMKYVVMDILRSKIIIAYTILLFVAAVSVFSLENNSAKGMLTLMNIVLIIVPLVAIIFAAIYYYNAGEFIELMVAQPVKRIHLMLSIYGGIATSLTIAFLIGCGIPVLLFNPSATGYTMIFCGVALSIVFVSIALLAAVFTRDKARGIGLVILLWLYFSILYDGLVLFMLFQMADYPMEKPMIGLSSLNPIDLSRIIILLRMDVSALMGYSGAVFNEFLGSIWGVLYAGIMMLGWIFIPSWLAIRRFNRKDL
jgi:Cu-processing system permease protein